MFLLKSSVPSGELMCSHFRVEMSPRVIDWSLAEDTDQSRHNEGYPWQSQLQDTPLMWKT